MATFTNKTKTTLIIICVVSTLFQIITATASGETDLSVLDSSDVAEIIVKGDRIHLVAQVQTPGEILYSSQEINATYVCLYRVSEPQEQEIFSFESDLTEEPYPNLFRLHNYINTSQLTAGEWEYCFVIHLTDGTRDNTTGGRFSIKESDKEPTVLDHTPDTVTTGDNIIITAEIDDPDQDPIIWVKVSIGGSEHELVLDQGRYSNNVGKMPDTVDSFTYEVYTGRKVDGDNELVFEKTFHINVINNGGSDNDTLPDVSDTTALPGIIRLNSVIEFTVTYMDNEGDPPEKIEIIFLNSTTEELIDTKVLMTQGGDFEEGVLFKREVHVSDINGIKIGSWKYKLIYVYKQSDFTITVKPFTILRSTPAGTPVLTDQSEFEDENGGTMKFSIRWEYDVLPTTVIVEIRDKEGENIYTYPMYADDDRMDTFERSVPLSDLVHSDKNIQYRFNCTYYKDSVRYFSTDWEKENVGSQKDSSGSSPALTVILVLVTIIILLSLFVFTFGKRDPY